MPVTFGTFGLGYLAIIGIPPFSGFCTKDGIIEAAFNKGGTSGAILGTAALIGAGITAFYMTRIMLMTFAGKRRWEERSRAEPHRQPQPHETPAPARVPPVMLWPMILLAIGSVGAGMFLIIGGRFANFLAPVDGHAAGITRGLDRAGSRRARPDRRGHRAAWAMYGRAPVPRRSRRLPRCPSSPRARTCMATRSTSRS